MKRALILLALAAIVALPFVLRPRRAAPERALDTVVVVTPNNEAIRHEFALGFEDWYRARTGRTVAVDWRVLGGTSEIERYLAGAYVAAFQAYWTGELGRPWSLAVQAGFADGGLGAAATPAAREARAAFLRSGVGCGIDVFFGGGPADFDEQAAAGRLVDPGLRADHPDWLEDDRLPLEFAGERFRDPQDRWFGCGRELLRDDLQPGCPQAPGLCRDSRAVGRPGRSAVPGRGRRCAIRRRAARSRWRSRISSSSACSAGCARWKRPARPRRRGRSRPGRCAKAGWRGCG